ncbi:unnamed protein product [Protopolystoma xenopodis]|uniref:Uncharacterized protein n=1 Tax=Protopolystoma xenopodis TaxID=117903 RepID=A0A3S5B3M1_9PLAT|nr:unnamed protein product [Protopolystoma xenopodis]
MQAKAFGPILHRDLGPIEEALNAVEKLVERLIEVNEEVEEENNVKALTQLTGILGSSITSPVSGGLIKLLVSFCSLPYYQSTGVYAPSGSTDISALKVDFFICLESLEQKADDPSEEALLTCLSGRVLQLLELQLACLTTWHRLEPPPRPGGNPVGPISTSAVVPGETVVPTANVAGLRQQGKPESLFQATLDAYEQLTQQMSLKFGFSVDHLRASHLRYASGPLQPEPTSASQTVEPGPISRQSPFLLLLSFKLCYYSPAK